MLIAGDLNAHPAVIPCLAKAISADRFVDLALAYSLGEGKRPAATFKFKLDECSGTRWDFIWVARIHLLLLRPVWSRIGGSLLTFLSLLAFALVVGLLMLLALRFASRSGLLVGLILLIGPPLRVHVLSRMLGIFIGMSFGLVPPDVVLAIGDAVSRSCVDDFWTIWSRSAEAGLFGAYCRAGGPTEAGSSAFLGRGLLRIRSRCLGGRAVGCSGASRLFRVSHSDEVDVHCAQYFVSSSLAPVLFFRRRPKSVADVLKVFGIVGLLSLGGMLC